MLLEKVTDTIRRLIARQETGQTLVEYGLVIGLVSIAALVGISLVSSQVDSLWGGIAGDVSDAVAGVLGLS